MNAIMFPGSMNVRPGPITRKYYANGREAWLVRDYKLTVNVADGEVRDGEVAIKDYSEGEGVLAALVGAGIVSEPLRYAPSGWVKIPICKVLRPVAA